MKTRTIKLKVTRFEVWYPEVEVPAHLSNGQALDYISDGVDEELTDYVYDDYRNKATLDTDTMLGLQ